jgi:hypothetical protein
MSRKDREQRKTVLRAVRDAEKKTAEGELPAAKGAIAAVLL